MRITQNWEDWKRHLLPLIERGEKDVFMFNDSHWSYKASSLIAHELATIALP